MKSFRQYLTEVSGRKVPTAADLEKELGADVKNIRAEGPTSFSAAELERLYGTPTPDTQGMTIAKVARKHGFKMSPNPVKGYYPTKLFIKTVGPCVVGFGPDKGKTGAFHMVFHWYWPEYDIGTSIKPYHSSYIGQLLGKRDNMYQDPKKAKWSNLETADFDECLKDLDAAIPKATDLNHPAAMVSYLSNGKVNDHNSAYLLMRLLLATGKAEEARKIFQSRHNQGIFGDSADKMVEQLPELFK